MTSVPSHAAGQKTSCGGGGAAADGADDGAGSRRLGPGSQRHGADGDTRAASLYSQPSASAPAPA